MAAYRRVDDLTVTCRLTACTPGSAPGPTLGIEYGKPLPFTTPMYITLRILRADCGTRRCKFTDLFAVFVVGQRSKFFSVGVRRVAVGRSCHNTLVSLTFSDTRCGTNRRPTYDSFWRHPAVLYGARVFARVKGSTISITTSV